VQPVRIQEKSVRNPMNAATLPGVKSLSVTVVNAGTVSIIMKNVLVTQIVAPATATKRVSRLKTEDVQKSPRRRRKMIEIVLFVGGKRRSEDAKRSNGRIPVSFPSNQSLDMLRLYLPVKFIRCNVVI
jgi:hypothetical protein